MKTCRDCNEPMIEAYIATVGDLRIVLSEYGGKSIGKIKCRVCPKCGDVQLQLESLDKLNKRLGK